MRIHPLVLALFMVPCTLASVAVAEPSCTPTAHVPTQNYPGANAVLTTNNLLLPTGKAVAAEGQKITIRGRVVDARCAPVKEAIVELWQNSPTGRWLLAGQEDVASANPVFAGAGRTYTDSDGRFTFITAFPAPIGKRAPFVNIKIIGAGLTTYSSALFFSDDVRNDKDDNYRKLAGKSRSDMTIKMQQDDTGALNGTIELVLAGKAPFRTY